MDAQIKIPEELISKVDTVIEKFNFKDQQEFVEEAVRDKILELQKKLFFEGSDEVAKGLAKNKVSEKEMLKDFDEFKHR